MKKDSEFIRNGTCSIFIFTEPLAGIRHAEVFRQRPRMDWARNVETLLEEYYPDAEKVVLVMDILNTHAISSLYEAFPSEKALKMTQRLENHYTPKHGSWLNIAEIELSAMEIQCFSRRIGIMEKLVSEIKA